MYNNSYYMHISMATVEFGEEICFNEEFKETHNERNLIIYAKQCEFGKICK